MRVPRTVRMGPLNAGELTKRAVDPAGPIGAQPHTPALRHKQRVLAGLHASGPLSQPFHQGGHARTTVRLTGDAKEDATPAAVLGSAEQDRPSHEVEVFEIGGEQLA